MCKRRLVVKEQEQPSTITPDSQITFLNSVADPQAGHNTRKQNSKSKEIRSSLSLSVYPLATKCQMPTQLGIPGFYLSCGPSLIN